MHDETPQTTQTRLTDNKYVQTAILCAALYLFLLSIKLLGTALDTSIGKDIINKLIQLTDSPLMGLMVGILSTSLIQSSSTTTSIVVGLVAAGASTGTGLTVQQAIPIVMGANIGTAVTNTLVSLGHLTRRDEFRRAFATAHVHDIFNIIAVLILFPIEYFFGYITHVTHFVKDLVLGQEGFHFNSPLNIIVKPVTKAIKCLFCDLIGCNETLGGIIMIVLSLAILAFSLTQFSKYSRKIFMGGISKLFDRVIFKNALTGMFFGMMITSVVQSSSITTSLCIPLTAAGILTLEQIFPFTLGANIGTTITAFLAAITLGQAEGIMVAMAHLVFNLSGTLAIYPFKPLRKIPLSAAKHLGEVVSKNRKIAFYYTFGVFFCIPGLVVLLHVIF